ncbi:diiron oxygenase [Streptomyces sp. NPDC047014]|uniref:diiron oxygenase n=1 Tax=Streptomyces sp. NPDC047014 TaxID=3155736 RepID=UPI0033E2F4BE
MRDSVRRTPPARLAVQRQRMGVRAVAVTKLLVNNRVYLDMGLDPRAARSQLRTDPHFRETLLWSGARVVPFLRDIGMITSADKHWWRHAGLLPEPQPGADTAWRTRRAAGKAAGAGGPAQCPRHCTSAVGSQ